MKILFIGNGIIRGTIGVDYISFLAFKYPHWQIENAGVNGDTLTKISQRLIKKLNTNAAYDAIVFEAGYNDIILPSFAHKGFLFRQTLKKLQEKGYNPLISPTDFENSYRAIIGHVQATCRAKVILTTMGCINENLQSELNAKRMIFNNIIRQVAKDFNCALADVSVKFDKILKQQQTRDYLMEDFFNTTYLDWLRTKFLNGADTLSRKRNLHLTINGMHLNSRGAEIFMKQIEKHLV